MTKLKIDYSDARDWYVTGDKEEKGLFTKLDKSISNKYFKTIAVRYIRIEDFI